MDKQIRSGLSNLTFKVISIPVERLCKVLIVVVAAPVLGAAGFGMYQFAVTTTGLLAICTDLGLGMWTTRALARNIAPPTVIVGTVMKLKSLAILPTVLVLALAAYAQVPGQARRTLVLLGVAAIANAFVDYFAAIFRGYERVRDEAWVNGIRALLVTGAGLAALRLQRSAAGLAAGVMLGTLASAAVGVWVLHRRYRLSSAFDRSPFDRALVRVAVREALPLWVAGLLSTLFFKCDVLLLRALAGDAELGAYSAAYKLFDTSLTLPIAILAVAFTPLARAHGERVRPFRLEFVLVASLFGLGAITGGMFYAFRGQLIGRIFGAEFVRATPSLRVLSFAVTVAFVNRGLTHFMMARDLDRRYLLLAAALLLVNVGANLILIPSMGGPGAAWATLITEVALMGGALWALSPRFAIGRGRRS